MQELIPTDIQEFLFNLGTFAGNTPEAFMEYAQAGAVLLFDKYVVLRDLNLEMGLGREEGCGNCERCNGAGRCQRRLRICN